MAHETLSAQMKYIKLCAEAVLLKTKSQIARARKAKLLSIKKKIAMIE